jgi:hypothetical protein
MAKKNNFKIEVDLNVVDPASIPKSQLQSESTVGTPTAPSFSDYKTLGPDPLFNARIENFLRTFNTEFFKNKESILTPALTRDVALKGKKAKDQQALTKVIEDESVRQLKFLKDLQTGVLNQANLLGTTAQVRAENLKASDEPDQQLISFYEEKISEIKETEAKLNQYFKESETKVTTDLKGLANKGFNEGYNERVNQSLSKVKKEEQDILNQYQKQFDKAVRTQWEQVASQVAFNVAQEFITKKEQEKASPVEYRPESKRLFSVVKEDIKKYMPVKPELTREEIIDRYRSQQGKFLPEDLRPKITPSTPTSSFLPPENLAGIFPAKSSSTYAPGSYSDPLFNFRAAFLRGERKTGKELSDYFTQQNQNIPDDLKKFISQTFFSAEGGSVKGPSITKSNRERIAEQLKQLMEAAGSGGSGKPPTGTTASPAGQPPNNGPPNIPPTAANLKYAPVSSSGSTDAIGAILAVNNLLMNGLEPIKKSLGAAAQATTKGGISASQVASATAGGLQGTGTFIGGAIGGIMGIPGGPAGVAAGIGTGSALGAAGGTAAGASFEVTSILSQIEENTSERITAFSPEVLGEKLDNQLAMLQLQLNTAKQYGSEIAELDAASNTLRQKMYQVSVELMIAFKPFILDTITLLSMLIDAVKIVGVGVAYFREWTKWFDPIFGPFARLASIFYGEESKKKKKKPAMPWIDPLKGLMKNRPQGLK